MPWIDSCRVTYRMPRAGRFLWRRTHSVAGRRLGLEPLEPRQLLAAHPLITEFMASNNNGIADGDGNASDWLEIHNPGDAAIDLAGYRLTDDPDQLDRWVLPSVGLDVGGYLVVFASGQETANYVDAQGNLHANFRLGADGEYLALVSPQGEVVSEFGSAQADYSAQITDVSYGYAQATMLIRSGSPSMYWIPLDDHLGTRWTEVGFDAAAEGFTTGTSALGFESRPNDRTNFNEHIQTSLREGAHAVFTRLEFTVDSAADISALKLRLKYDNGFIAYLNGVKVAEENVPANPGWFATAPSNTPRDTQAIVPVDFDLSPHVGLLVDGPNVLAIHGLNNISDNTDMLLSAELIADQPISQSALGYLPTATPGARNFALNAITGPLIARVTENPGAVDDNQDLVVTAALSATKRPRRFGLAGVPRDVRQPGYRAHAGRRPGAGRRGG